MVQQTSIPFFQKDEESASLSIRSVNWRIAKDLLKEYHYLRDRQPAGIKKIFGFYFGYLLVGVAVFTNTRCREWDKKGRILELARFVLREEIPFNSESKFLSKLFPILRKEIDYIIAYSDPEVGHRGTIYKASGFKNIGKTNKRKDTFYVDGERISARTIWDKYGTSSIPLLKKILGDRLKTREREGKLLFIKELRRKIKWHSE